MYVHAINMRFSVGGAMAVRHVRLGGRSGRARADGVGGRGRHPATPLAARTARWRRRGRRGACAGRSKGLCEGTLRRDFSKGLFEGTFERDFRRIWTPSGRWVLGIHSDSLNMRRPRGRATGTKLEGHGDAL